MKLEDLKKELRDGAVVKNPSAKKKRYVSRLRVKDGLNFVELDSPLLLAALEDIGRKGWMVRSGLHMLSPCERVVLSVLERVDVWSPSKSGGASVQKIRLGDELVNGKRVRCYVSPGDGPDRWTVVYPDQPENPPGCVACVGMSGHSSAQLGRHLGKRVKLADLPESLQRTVQADCAD